MSNFGIMRQLRVGGLPVGEMLEARYRQPAAAPRASYGSIIAVIATDAPLITHQLNRVAKRAALGIGRVGSSAMHGSGEIVLAFSTANKVPRETRKMVYRMKILLDQRLDPLYEAVIEATEEAILNALCMARDMDGVNGNLCRALPLERREGARDRLAGGERPPGDGATARRPAPSRRGPGSGPGRGPGGPARSGSRDRSRAGTPGPRRPGRYRGRIAAGVRPSCWGADEAPPPSPPLAPGQAPPPAPALAMRAI